MTDLLDVVGAVTTAFDQCGIPYTIGGSLASSFSGEPRTSVDADIVVDLSPTQVGPLLAALGPEFYADADALGRAVRTKRNANVIHRPSGVKVDLFVAGSRLELRQLQRRRLVRVGDPERSFYMHSPEDILLQKLHWFRLGGGVSDRQWRDAVSIVVVQGPRLDRAYLAATATTEGLTDLLGRAYEDAAPS